MRTLLAIGLAITCAALLSACSGTVGVPYDPKSNEEISGWLTVDSLAYNPPPPIAPNQIKNTAIGTLFLEQPVSAFATEGLKKELRLSGISTKIGAPCLLSGAVQEFQIDDLGYSVDWRSAIQYTVKDASGAPLYNKAFTSAFRSEKSILVLNTGISRMASDPNLGLLQDPEFQRLVRSRCPKGAN